MIVVDRVSCAVNCFPLRPCQQRADEVLDDVREFLEAPVPLDPNGDGVVNELDAAYLGYYWGETTFEELWIPLPAPNWD